MAFLKFTEGARPGKKLPTPKRSEEEMNDSRRRYEQKRARKFQTSFTIKRQIKRVVCGVQKIMCRLCLCERHRQF